LPNTCAAKAIHVFKALAHGAARSARRDLGDVPARPGDRQAQLSEAYLAAALEAVDAIAAVAAKGMKSKRR